MPLSPPRHPRWVPLLWSGVCAALALTLASPVDAACSDAPVGGELKVDCVDHVGIPVCFNKPLPVPGLDGMPSWPLTTTDAPANSPTRNDISDPRWGGAPLRPIPSDATEPTLTEQALYRLVVDSFNNPTELAVSIQLKNITGSPTANDFFYFGLATDDGGVARGFKLALNELTGQHLPAAPGQVTWFAKESTTWSSGRNYPADGWIKGSVISVWNSAEKYGVNGVMAAIEFKVDLTKLNISGKKARMMLGADIDFGRDVTTNTSLGRIKYFTPKIDKCADRVHPTSGVLLKGAEACLYGTDATNTKNPFLANPKQWTPVTAIGVACTGIRIGKISTTFLCKDDNYTNCVDPGAGKRNSFTVAADAKNQTTTLAEGDIEATFSMSNWGSTGTPAEWKPLFSDSRTAVLNTVGGNDLVANPIKLDCGNVGSPAVCNQSIQIEPTDPDEKGFHQCLLAGLKSTAQSINKVTFETPAAYTNTRFGEASEIVMPAEINLKGLVNAVPAAANGDVYLHVVASNMPAFGPNKIPAMNVASLEALRAQIDTPFGKLKKACVHPEDQCIPLDGSAGLCSSPCGFDNSCPPNTQRTTVANRGCFCIPELEEFEQSDVCTFTGVPQNGGYNPTKSSLTGEQRLTAEYPTYEIIPYYDSGKTVTVNGKAVRRLIPMPTFGVHAWHDGDYYGWTHTLLDASGNKLPEVFPNVFKLTVNAATGLARMKVRLTAESSQPADTLYEIAGTATPLGLALGNATVTGVSQTRTLDLSKSSVTVTKILDNNGKELVSGVGAGLALTRQAGALPGVATFKRSGFPTINLQVVDLPFLGQIITMQVTAASVANPASCPLLFGTAPIKTSIRITDPQGTVTIEGTDTWSCVPFQLLNF